MTVKGFCKLCLDEKELQRSHLIPKSVYKKSRSGDPNKPHPTVLSRRSSRQSSYQVMDYVFCSHCEQHLAREGEDYAMRLLHAPGSFPFLEQLTKSGPGMGTGAFRYYTGEMTPGINREKLGYFATSVFWRAGIHTWHQDDNKEISINFTPDERESLRQYMLGNVSFPKNAGLMTFVCSDAASQQIFWMPGENQKTSERVFLLGIRGITFFFSIGDRMPERFAKYCMMNSPGRWITIRDCSKPNTIWTLG